MGWLNINGNWIGRHSSSGGWGSYWRKQSEFFLDGTIITVGSDKYFKDKSVNGRNFLITGYDFASDWTTGFPYKSAATISAPAGDAALIAADINNFLYAGDGTPNAIPVVSLFQDIDYEHKIFCKHDPQRVVTVACETMISGVFEDVEIETYEPRVSHIFMAQSILSGADLTKAYSDFVVPAEVVTAVKWVDGTNGLDTNDGSKAHPWQTPAKVITSASVNDTVYFKTFNHVVTSLVIAKTYNWKAIGRVKISTGDTNYAMAITANNPIINRFIFDGGGNTSNGTIYNLGGTSTFVDCYFQNEKTNIVAENSGLTNTYQYCVFNSRIANTGLPQPFQVPTVDTCYFFNALASCAGNAVVTNCKFKNTRSTGTYLGCLNFSGTNSQIVGSTFLYAITALGFIKAVDVYYNKFYAEITGAAAIGTSANTAEANIKNNLFYNNDITPTPINPFFINLENPKSFDIQKNTFYSITKNGYYHVYINTTSEYAVTPCRMNYNKFISGSFLGTIVRFNGEAAHDNCFDSAEIMGNVIFGHRWMYPEDGTSGVHGIIFNGGTNAVIKYNNITGCHLGLVVKNGANGEAYTSGGVSYNLFKDCIYAIYIRGIKGLNIFNNTIKHSNATYAASYGVGIKVDTNTAIDPDVASENVILKNNIYDIDATTSEANIVFDAWAAAHGCVAENEIMHGGSHAITAGATTYDTVALAQVGGIMDGCVDTDPLLTDLIPQSGSPAIGAGEDLGVAYDDGLDASTDWGDDNTCPVVVTKQQGAEWDCGAYVS